MRVRRRELTDQVPVERFLHRWGALPIARLGQLVDPMAHPGLVADDGGRIAGVLAYVVDGPACEVLALFVDDRGRGIGTRLMDEAARVARQAGCTRMWLITSNENLDALGFYQRRGFRLAALHRGAVDDARARLKPDIPRVSDDGIEIHDEIELERTL